MINFELFSLTFIANDSLWILFVTIAVSAIYNFYLRSYSLLYRILPTWIFAYMFSLFFVHLYDDWLRKKVESYAQYDGYIFSLANDAPKLPPEFSVYLEALNHDTWRNMYFLTGVVISLVVTIFVEFLISIAIRNRSRS